MTTASNDLPPDAPPYVPCLLCNSYIHRVNGRHLVCQGGLWYWRDCPKWEAEKTEDDKPC